MTKGENGEALVYALGAFALIFLVLWSHISFAAQQKAEAVGCYLSCCQACAPNSSDASCKIEEEGGFECLCTNLMEPFSWNACYDEVTKKESE